MNIDERLESLAQTVERIAQNQGRQDERLQALVQTVELLAHMQMKSEERIAKNEILLAHVMESIDSLARIAHAHEQRITGLEGRG